MKAPTLEVEAPALSEAPRIQVNDAAQMEAVQTESFIDIPINLENWKELPRETSEQLLWFHQFVLDNKLNWKSASKALDYDQTVVYRVLKGSYSGSWPNVVKAILAFRKREESPLTLKEYDFVEIEASRLIFKGLDYARKNKCITIVVGESGQGKSVSAQAWKRANNHGKTVMVIAPAYGGVAALLREIGIAIGINKYMRAGELHQAVLRGFNSERILVVDEAHRLLPGDRRSSNPVCLEILRDIHDRTGCAMGLIATARFDTELKRGEYMFEQLIGRSRVIRLPKAVSDGDVEPIVRQYFSRPDREVMGICKRLAGLPGRLRILVEVLKAAQRVAEGAGEKLGVEHLLKAIKVLEVLQGEALLGKGK